MDQQILKNILKKKGADLVGFTTCKDYFSEYTSAVIIGVSALHMYRLEKKDTLHAMNELMDFINVSARQLLIQEGYGTWGPLFSQEEFSHSQNQNFVPHRELAIRAGLGILGKNYLLVTPQVGPRLQLTTVLTTMPLVPDPPLPSSFSPCHRCTACIDQCPQDALSDHFHQERCTKCYKCALACPVGEDFEIIQEFVTPGTSIWTMR